MTIRNRRGTLFIEVLISIVIVGIAAMMVFSVAIYANRAQAEVEPYAAIETSVQGLSDALKNYVAAEISTSAGPGGRWALPGDDSSCKAYALDTACDHNATQFLDPMVLKKCSDPKNCLTYRVSAPSGSDGPLSIRFSLKLK